MGKWGRGKGCGGMGGRMRRMLVTRCQMKECDCGLLTKKQFHLNEMKLSSTDQLHFCAPAQVQVLPQSTRVVCKREKKRERDYVMAHPCRAY